MCLCLKKTKYFISFSDQGWNEMHVIKCHSLWGIVLTQKSCCNQRIRQTFSFQKWVNDVKGKREEFCQVHLFIIEKKWSLLFLQIPVDSMNKSWCTCLRIVYFLCRSSFEHMYKASIEYIYIHISTKESKKQAQS